MPRYTKFQEQSWSGRHDQGVVFDWHSYEKCDFRDCSFVECRWSHGRFRYLHLINTAVTSCVFDECKFLGQYTYLGPSVFRDCTFRACLFDTIQPWHATFQRCRFPATVFRNVRFYGQSTGEGTLFHDVDMSDASFTFTAFSRGVDLSSVRLPRSGIRVFRNPTNQFLRALFAASGADERIADLQERMTKCARRGILTLSAGFDSVIQDPVVEDNDFLAAVLSEADDRTLFEAAAAPFEIRADG